MLAKVLVLNESKGKKETEVLTNYLKQMPIIDFLNTI